MIKCDACRKRINSDISRHIVEMGEYEDRYFFGEQMLRRWDTSIVLNFHRHCMNQKFKRELRIDGSLGILSNENSLSQVIERIERMMPYRRRIIGVLI